MEGRKCPWFVRMQRDTGTHELIRWISEVIPDLAAWPLFPIGLFHKFRRLNSVSSPLQLSHILTSVYNQSFGLFFCGRFNFNKVHALFQSGDINRPFSESATGNFHDPDTRKIIYGCLQNGILWLP